LAALDAIFDSHGRTGPARLASALSCGYAQIFGNPPSKILDQTPFRGGREDEQKMNESFTKDERG
jgi:hypothetical protein